MHMAEQHTGKLIGLTFKMSRASKVSLSQNRSLYDRRRHQETEQRSGKGSRASHGLAGGREDVVRSLCCMRPLKPQFGTACQRRQRAPPSLLPLLILLGFLCRF